METLIVEKTRIASLLKHFSALADTRQSWRVMYPLREVLLLVVCGTIAASDDYDEIVDWGEAHLPFLRRFLPFDWGIPCADWLRTLMNRIDPELFAACFMSWASELRPAAPAHIALDGKTSRRSHDRRAGRKPLWFPPSPPTNAWCSARRRSRRRPMSSPPSRPCSTASPRPARLPARWSPSTRLPAIPRSPG